MNLQKAIEDYFKLEDIIEDSLQLSKAEMQAHKILQKTIMQFGRLLLSNKANILPGTKILAMKRHEK